MLTLEAKLGFALGPDGPFGDILGRWRTDWKTSEANPLITTGNRPPRLIQLGCPAQIPAITFGGKNRVKLKIRQRNLHGLPAVDQPVRDGFLHVAVHAADPPPGHHRRGVFVRASLSVDVLWGEAPRDADGEINHSGKVAAYCRGPLHRFLL